MCESRLMRAKPKNVGPVGIPHTEEPPVHSRVSLGGSSPVKDNSHGLRP